MPEILKDKSAIIRNIFSSGIATGGLTAILLNWLYRHDLVHETDSVE